MLIDKGSSANIIFSHAFWRMILEDRKEQPNTKDMQGSLYGFGNNVVPIQGFIDLSTTFDTNPQEVIALIGYYIIDLASP